MRTVTETVAGRGATSGLCSSIELPDGRSLDLCLRDGYWGWLDDDMVFVRPWGFDLDAIRSQVHVWQGAHDRMVPYGHGRWLADHVPSSCRHLHDEHGHLTLVVDSFGRILDELVAAGG
jgi:pimeloyl-ACP methyl ester carboxylesterase